VNIKALAEQNRSGGGENKDSYQAAHGFALFRFASDMGAVLGDVLAGKKARGFGGKPRATGKASGDGDDGLALTCQPKSPPSAVVGDHHQGKSHQHGAQNHFPLRIRRRRRQDDALLRLTHD
jgi:hypothetical protein